MNDYELSLLINPDLEPKLEAQVKKIKSLVEKFGGSVEKEDNQGKQRLAYSIDREGFAIYYYLDVKLPAEAPQKLSGALNIADGILRYLLVKSDPKLQAQRANSQEDKVDEQ